MKNHKTSQTSDPTTIAPLAIYPQSSPLKVVSLSNHCAFVAHFSVFSVAVFFVSPRLRGYQYKMQNKPNSKNQKITTTSYVQTSYTNIPPRRRRKNKPKQTQSSRGETESGAGSLTHSLIYPFTHPPSIPCPPRSYLPARQLLIAGFCSTINLSQVVSALNTVIWRLMLC